MRIDITGDTAGSGTTDEDLLAALLTQVRVIANGGDFRIAAPAADLWRYGKLRSQFALTNTLITAISQTDVELGVLEFSIDFTLGQNPRTNKLDLRALLPAHMFTSLVLEIDIGATSVLGTLYTLDSGNVRITVEEVSLNGAEVKELVRPGRFFSYYLTAQEHTISAAAVNFGFNVDLPVGKIIRKVMLTSIRNSLRVDGDDVALTGVHAFRVRDKRRGDVDLIENAWLMSQSQDRHQWGIAPDAGVTVADLDAVGSLDARGYTNGQVQVQANTQAPAGTTFLRTLVEEIV